MPVMKHLIRWHHSSGKADVADRSARDLMFSYRRIPVGFGEQVTRLQQAVRRDLGLVSAPVLLMQGRRDRTIPADSVRILFDGLGTADREIVWWPRSAHPITMDCEREAVWARSYAFIAAHSPCPAAPVAG